MRRFIALFLLVLLPLECSWAAVASYCAHESQGQHFGHHAAEHEHAQAGDGSGDSAKAEVGSHAADGTSTADTGDLASSAAESSPGPAPMVDLDCHGHGHCTGMVSVTADILAPPAAVSLRPAAQDQASAPAATRPERPQWARLA